MVSILLHTRHFWFRVAALAALLLSCTVPPYLYCTYGMDPVELVVVVCVIYLMPFAVLFLIVLGDIVQEARGQRR
jgi:hypothetical protein